MRALFTLLVLHAAIALAMPADPRPAELTQPDGTKVTLHLRGDEFYHWYEDSEGFTVLQDGNRYVYATLDAAGQLARTPLEVGKANPRAAGLAPHLLPDPARRPRNLNDGHAPYRPWLKRSATTTEAAPEAIGANGTVKNLVILAKFSDHQLTDAKGAVKDGRPQGDYDVLFNQVGGDPTLAPTGSVRDAYAELSYNVVNLQSTVAAWVTLPQTAAYYVGTNKGLTPGDYPNNAQKMVEDALAAVDPLVNFGDFDTDNDGYVDAIDIIHSGYGAETTGAPANTIWSHKGNLPNDWTSADDNGNKVKVKVNAYHTEPALWGVSGTEITHIGVICHETGHFIGLPDLYDTDKSTDKLSSGLGSWCMMANAWGFDNDQLRPPHFSAWCRAFLGWTTPVELTAPGTYSLAQAETNRAIYKITQGFPAGEYLLVENRQPVRLDGGIPRGGLAVFHVDENVGGNTNEGFPGQPGWPENGNHYKVALLQADGLYDLERNLNRGDAGDLFSTLTVSQLGMNSIPSTDPYQLGAYYPSTNRITDVSAPGATMTFTFGFHPFVVYVDQFRGSPAGNGSYASPFNTVGAAYNAAGDGTAIVIRGADYSEQLPALQKQVTLDSWLGPAIVR